MATGRPASAFGGLDRLHPETQFTPRNEPGPQISALTRIRGSAAQPPAFEAVAKATSSPRTRGSGTGLTAARSRISTTPDSLKRRGIRGCGLRLPWIQFQIPAFAG